MGIRKDVGRGGKEREGRKGTEGKGGKRIHYR